MRRIDGRRLLALAGLAGLAAAPGPAAAQSTFSTVYAGYYTPLAAVAVSDMLWSSIDSVIVPGPGGGSHSPRGTPVAPPAPPATAAAAAPCVLSAGRDTPADPGASSQPLRATVPQRVVAQRLTGCATLVFHIGADGRATEIRVERESPAGHDIGQAAQAALAGARFAPALAGPRWYQATQVFLAQP